MSAPTEPLVLVSAAKGEQRTLANGFRLLGRQLRGARCEVRALGPGPGAGITPAALAPAALLVLGCPAQPLSPDELEALRLYLASGGAVLALLGEGGAGAGLAPLLEPLGIGPRRDCAIQAFVDFEHLHPKQAVVEAGGLLSPEMAAACVAGRGSSSSSSAAHAAASPSGRGAPAAADGAAAFRFVYPHGCTLAVQPPALAFLSSGPAAHPPHAHRGAGRRQECGGRLAVLGSAAAFGDEWLGREGNASVLEYVAGWLLLDPGCQLAPGSLREAELPGLAARRRLAPATSIAALAQHPRACLQVWWVESMGWHSEARSPDHHIVPLSLRLPGSFSLTRCAANDHCKHRLT